MFTAALLSAILMMPDTVSINLDPSVTVTKVSPNLFGVFFEEINQAGEGGIYAELLQNRGFEKTGNGLLPVGWRQEGSGTVTLDESQKMNAERPGSLKMTAGTADLKLINDGFWGIPVKSGQTYSLEVWTKGSSPLMVSLNGTSGVLAAGKVEAARDWKETVLTLMAKGSDDKASLQISIPAGGMAYVGYTSLMVSGERKTGGLRDGLVDRVKDTNPSFIRFPGGCYVEGEFQSIRWNWKDTLGPIEGRKGMPRTQWGYPASNGLGFLEYLELCERTGAKALFVVNVGMSHQEVVPMEKMGPMVQDALDGIEYAIGSTDTKWGAQRAKDGHPKPFDLEYVQIGNENGGPNYNERFKLFSEAIYAKYPKIKRVACDWGGAPTSAPFELLDQHFYNSPTWFWANVGHYDNFPRDGHKIYVGEYAVTRGSGRGNLAGALGEAAFMTGLERNGDVVKMASYAPFFENVNNRQWNPNAVLFNATTSYGTPSYWNQVIFGENRIDRVIKQNVKGFEPKLPPVGGNVALMTWRTHSEYKDISLTTDGVKKEVSPQLSDPRGNWKVQDGVVSQDRIEDDRRAILKGLDTHGAKKVVLELKARKISGDEGFIIQVETGPDRTIQWNLGGWDNTVTTFQVNDSRVGRGADIKIEPGRWYDIRIEQTADKVSGYLDGKLIETVEIQPAPDFASVAGIDDKSGDLILKVVNGAGTARNVDLTIPGMTVKGPVKVTTLSGGSLDAENSFEKPKNVYPKSTTISAQALKGFQLAPYSITIVRAGLAPATARSAKN